MASGLYIDRDGYEDFYLDLDDVDEAAKNEWEFVRKHQEYIEVKDAENNDQTENLNRMTL